MFSTSWAPYTVVLMEVLVTRRKWSVPTPAMLYAAQPAAFDEESEQVGLLVASHAAVAFADARKLDQLAESVATRDLIGQAKGILMERHQLTTSRAFQVLVAYSQHSNRELRNVAAELADTGRLPEVPPRSR